MRYRRTWALRDCSVAVPTGHISAICGSNGAGKTTLLQCAVGLTKPNQGTVTVLGGIDAGSPDALERIAFVGQEAPLYRHISVNDMLELAACLNKRFDSHFARSHLRLLEIPMESRIGQLSGGQHSQVALSVALARHPDLLILDEPLAHLDPVARHDVMGLLAARATEDGTAVIISSHVVSDLERVASYLVLVADGGIQLAGKIDELLSRHAVISGPIDKMEQIVARSDSRQLEHGGARSRILVRHEGADDAFGGLEQAHPTLEELTIGYLRMTPVASVPPQTDTRDRRVRNRRR